MLRESHEPSPDKEKPDSFPGNQNPDSDGRESSVYTERSGASLENPDPDFPGRSDQRPDLFTRAVGFIKMKANYLCAQKKREKRISPSLVWINLWPLVKLFSGGSDLFSLWAWDSGLFLRKIRNFRTSIKYPTVIVRTRIRFRTVCFPGKSTTLVSGSSCIFVQGRLR